MFRLSVQLLQGLSHIFVKGIGSFPQEREIPVLLFLGRNGRMRQSQKMAVSGLLTALAAMLMLLVSVVPTGSYALPAAAGVLVYIISFVVSRSYAWMSFAAVSLLSLFLCADKEAAFVFVLFFGYYPLLKRWLDKIRLRVLAFLLKLMVFNAAAFGVYGLLLWLFGLSEESFRLFGMYLPWLFLFLVNILFVVYDYALTRFVVSYEQKINKFVTNLWRRF